MAANIGMLTFSTRLDKSGLSQGLNELKGVKASIGVSLDFDDLSVARMEQRLSGLKLGLKVTVDDSALVGLNQKISETASRFDRAQRKFDSSPLTPKVDLTQLRELDAMMGRLKGIDVGVKLVGDAKADVKALADAVAAVGDVKIGAKVTVDRAALDSIKDKTVTIKTDIQGVVAPKADTSALIKSISDAVKQDYGTVGIKGRVTVDRAAFDAIKSKTIAITAKGAVIPTVNTSLIQRGIAAAIAAPQKSVMVGAIVKVDRAAYDAIRDKSVKITAAIAPSMDTAKFNQEVAAKLGGVKVEAMLTADQSQLKAIEARTIAVKVKALPQTQAEVISGMMRLDKSEVAKLRSEAITIDAKVADGLIDTGKLTNDVAGAIARGVERGFKSAAPALAETSSIVPVRKPQAEQMLPEPKTLGVVVAVDDRRLFELNEHLSLKEEHFDRVQRKFSSRPLTPTVDLKPLDQVDGVAERMKRAAPNEAKAVKGAKVAQEPKPKLTEEEKDQALSQRKLAKSLESTIGGALGDGFKAAKSLDILGVLLTPFKLAFGVISDIAESLIGGAVRKLSKGIAAGIYSIDDIFGGVFDGLIGTASKAAEKVSSAFFGKSKREAQGVKFPADRVSKPETMGLKIEVDDRRLFELNEHLLLKEEHFDKVQRKLSSAPLKPRADLSDLDGVDGDIIDIEAEVIVDRSAYDDLVSKTIKIDTDFGGGELAKMADPSGLTESISSAISDGFKGAKTGNIGAILGAPVKAALGVLAAIGGTVGSGLVLGLTQQVTKGLGTGLGNALEGAIAPAFGSSELLAAKAGGGIASAIVGGFKSEIASLNGLIDQQLEKIKDKTTREDLTEKVSQVRALPQQAVQAAQSSIGQGEIDRQNLIRQNIQQKERGRGDRQVSSQALTNFREADAQVKDITPRAQAQFTALDQRESSAVVGFKVNRAAAEKAQKAVNDYNQTIEKRIQAIQKQIVAASSIRDRATDPAKAEQAAQIVIDLTKKIEAVKSDPATARQLTKLVEAQERAAAPFLAQIGELEQIARDRQIVGRALSEAQATAEQAKAKLEGLGGVFAQTEAVGSVRTATAKFEGIKESGTAQIEQLKAQVEQRQARLGNLQQNFDQADSQLNAFIADYTQQRSRLESQIGQATAEGDIKGADALRSRLDSLDSNAQAGDVLDLLAEGADAAEAPLKRELAAIDALEKQIAMIDGAISAAGKDVEMAQRRLGTLQKDVKPKQYTDIARAVAGPNVDERRLPRIEVDDKTLDSLGANAGYNPRNNTITVRKNLAEALKRSQLSDEQILTLSEELSHAYDVDFGSERGLQASANRTVLPDRKLTPTVAEIEAVAPDVSRYAPDRREIELNGKVRANRAATEVISKRDSSAVLDRLGDVRKSLDVSGLAAQLTNLAKQAKAVGLNPQELLGAEAAKIQGISALIDPTVAKVASGALSGSALESSLELLSGKMAGIQSALDDRAKQIAEITQDKAFADFAMGDAFETPDLPEGFTRRQIDRASQGDRRQLERQDSPLDELRVTPRRTAFYSPDPRAYEFEDAAQTRKRENTERVAARREQFKQDVVGGLKAAPGKVKDFVLNPDRNIDINVDAIRENLEATGMAIYKGGLLAAKAMDATADTFRQLAESPLGQMMLSSAADAGQAIGGVAIASYKLAAGIEAITLDLIPAGRTLKGALKQTAVPALAFGAATQFIPGGQALAGGAVDLAQAALGPIGQSVAGGLGGQAAEALSFLPDAFGLQATITEGIQSLFSGSAGAITSGLAEAAVPILGGKALTTAASRVLPGATEVKALPPSREPFQLPFQAKKIEKPIEVEIAGVNEAKLLPPKSAPSIGSSSAKSAEPSSGGASALSIAVPSRAIAPKPNIDRAVAEASAAARRAGEIAASVVGTARALGKTTGDVVESAKEIQQRVSEGYKALQGAIKRGDKGLARALQSSIVKTSDQAQKDLDGLIEQAKESGDRKTVSDLGGVKGRINSNLTRTQKLGPKIDAIEVPATEVPEGLARASVSTGPNLLQRAGNKLRSLLPVNEQRLARMQGNFSSIVDEVYEFSEAVGGLSEAPKLRIDSSQLKQLGADAFYEAQTNTVVISKELASILELPAHELSKYADQLQAVVHEARHAAQTSGGTLGIDNAAQGINVALRDAAELTPKETVQARASTRAYAGKADRRNVFKLEADAAIFERETPKILDNARIRTESLTDTLPKRPLSKVGKQLADLRDAAENVVGNAIDNVRLRLTGQKELIPQARADRLQKRVGNINRRETESQVATADAAILEIGNRQTDEESAKVKRDNTRTARQTQKVQREIEQKYDLPREADRDIILGDPDEGNSQISGAIGQVKSALKTFNGAIADRFRKQAKLIADDAKVTIVDLNTNRLASEARSVDNPAEADRAKRLGRLQQRAETATAGIDSITSKETLSRGDRGKLRDLKAEVASVYKEIGKPLPDGGGGLLDVGDKIGGLIGKFKGLGIALLALPFAFDALQGLKQFGKDSIDATINYDRLRNSLTATTGSARAADKDIALTETTAKDFGLDKSTTRESIQQLRGSTQGTAIEGQETEELFKAISAISATRGLGKEAQGRAVTALSQIASKGGAASSEEVKGQLAEAIPGSSGIAARGLGLTQKEFSRKLNNGDIGSTEFLEAFTSQAKAESLGGATKNADNLNGSLANLNNSTLALQENTGKAISPALSIGAKVAAAGLDLLGKSNGLLSTGLTVLTTRALFELGKSLLAIPAIAKVAASGLSSIGGAAKALAASAVPMLALTIAVVAATAAFDAFKAGFVASENIQQFKAFGDGAVKELDRINKAAKGAKGAVSAKGDGAEFAKNKKFVTQNEFLDFVPIVGQLRGLEKNKLIAQNDTDKREFREGIEGFGKAATDLEKPETEAEDRKSLEAAKSLDKQASELRAKRNLLGNDSTKKAEVARIDQQLRDNKAARKEAFAPAADRAQLASGKLENLRSSVAETKADQNISGKERDDRLALLDKEIKRYEEIQTRQQKLGKEIGTSVNPISTLNEKLTELKLTLDDIASKSKIKLDIALADNAENLNVGLKGNQFAKNDLAIADATAQETAATEQFTQSQSAVDKLKKEVGTEELTSRLNEIKVGATGRTIGLDSSIGDIELASKDATKDEQRALDLLKNLKDEENKLPGLRRDAAQAKTNTFETKQAGALARIDDKAEIRGQDDAKTAAGRQIALNKELVGNTIKSDEDLAIKRADLEKRSVADRAATVKNRVELLNAELSNGTVSAEEYVKRRRALAGEEIQIATDASNAEVSVKQAANAKILKDLERASRDRNLKSKITNNEAQIQLAKDELNPNISDEKLAIKSAEVNLEGTRSELSNAKAELEGLNKAFASGALNQEVYNDQASALKGNISDLGVKEAQGELAVRKAINAELLKQFERAKATRELDARIANNEGRKALIGRQLSGPRKLESEDVAIESAKLDITATDLQTANAQKDLSDLNEKFAKGLIKVGEFTDGTKELKGTLSDLSVQKATNQLALLEAQNTKTLKSFERLNAEANARIEVRQFNRSIGAQQRQFQTGQAVGLGGQAEQSKIEREGTAATIKLRTSEIAGVKRLVQQRVLTESEGRDRILGIEADIRSKRKSLLDSQIAEYVRGVDARIAAIQRASDAEQRAFNKQKTRLEQESALIDRRSSLLNARKELANTVATGRTSALEGRASELGEKRNLAARLRSGDVGSNERKEIERQIGKPGFAQSGASQELALLESQQAIAREIENERLSGLEQQQKFARESLALDEKRLEIAQRIAELDAKGGEAQAKGELAKSKLELAKARKTGDVDQIAAAEDLVTANKEGVTAATEKRQFVEGGRGFAAEEAKLKRQNLKAGQRNELDAVYREGNAADDRRRIEKAALKDALGIQSSVFGGAERNTRSLRPTSDETNQALYSEEGSTAGNNAKFQSEQLAALRELIAATKEKSSGGQTTNNFNGGQDAVQQYVALQQQQQAAKARR